MRRRWIRLDFKSVRRIRVFSAILVLLFFGMRPFPLFAEWYKDYEAAQKMIKKGQWGEAIPRLRAALAEKRDEENNIKFYGMKFDDYFPHFYLGLAYFGLKDYKTALAEFEQSEGTGAIKKRPDLFKQLTDAKTVARAQLLTGEPSHTLEPPVPKISPVPLQQQPAPKPEEPVRPPPETNPGNESAKTKVQDAVLSEPPKTEVTPSAEQRPADSTAIKKIMQEGARKFFEGNYDAAIRILSNANGLNPTDASAPFLLGCSYAAKYLLYGSQDKSLFQKAEAAFRKSRKIDPNYRVANSSYISPAVLQIYEKS